MKMMGKNTIAILSSASEVIRNRDIHFPFRQDSDFLYLTGFNEPDAVMVLIPGRKHGEYIIFCRERDPEQETWNGRRAGQEGAIETHGADDSFPIDDIDDILPGLLEGTNSIFNVMGRYSEFDKQLIGWVNHIKRQSSGRHVPSEFVALDYLLHDMRLYKSREELRLINGR
jgi:Xaa-Pro aminopeptidase